MPRKKQQSHKIQNENLKDVSGFRFRQSGKDNELVIPTVATLQKG